MPPSQLLSEARVLHLIESDGLYGAERVVLALGAQAALDPAFPAAIGCIVKDAHQPSAIVDAANGAGVPAFKVPLSARRAGADLIALRSRCRDMGIALIHSHNYKASLAGYLVTRRSRTAIMATCHLWFDEPNVKWTYHCLTRLEQRLYPRFDHVVAVSPAILEQLRVTGVPAARLSQITNGIAIERSTSEATAALRLSLGLPSDAFVVVNVGRLAEQKAQHLLISAARVLYASNPSLRVLILGEGHRRELLEEQIRHAGLTACVQLLGFQANVQPFLGLADAFVLPSLDEGLPIALLEALAAAVPVVSTPVGAIPHFLTHDKSALLVPVGSVDALVSAIARLVADPPLRQQLARAGLEAVQDTHTAAAMYRSYRSLYAQLLHR